MTPEWPRLQISTRCKRRNGAHAAGSGVPGRCGPCFARASRAASSRIASASARCRSRPPTRSRAAIVLGSGHPVVRRLAALGPAARDPGGPGDEQDRRPLRPRRARAEQDDARRGARAAADRRPVRAASSGSARTARHAVHARPRQVAGLWLGRCSASCSPAGCSRARVARPHRRARALPRGRRRARACDARAQARRQRRRRARSSRRPAGAAGRRSPTTSTRSRCARWSARDEVAPRDRRAAQRPTPRDMLDVDPRRQVARRPRQPCCRACSRSSARPSSSTRSTA